MKKTLLFCCIVIYSITNVLAGNDEFPKLTGPYFGQKPPGKTAEPFGLGIVGLHQDIHSAMIFSPDGNEAY